MMMMIMMTMMTTTMTMIMLIFVRLLPQCTRIVSAHAAAAMHNITRGKTR
jgi:hypothetical protein